MAWLFGFCPFPQREFLLRPDRVQLQPNFLFDEQRELCGDERRIYAKRARPECREDLQSSGVPRDVRFATRESIEKEEGKKGPANASSASIASGKAAGPSKPSKPADALCRMTRYCGGWRSGNRARQWLQGPRPNLGAPSSSQSVRRRR